MKPKPAELDAIQRWMQTVIMHPGGVPEGVDSPEARQHLDVERAELESVISRSRALDSESRLEIYVNAYYERLLECLREEFAATRHATGEELFDALAFGYLQSHPSRSYTLNLLGAKFPQFLGESRLHARALPEGADENWPAFIIELATFERLQRDVFDGPGNEGRATLDFARLASLSGGDWATLRLIPSPCLRLQAFAHPVHAYWTDWKANSSPAVPRVGETYLALSRRDYVVERRELTAPQYALLDALALGATLAEAIGTAACGAETDVPALEERLRDWFADWTRAGLFIDLSSGRHPAV